MYCKRVWYFWALLRKSFQQDREHKKTEREREKKSGSQKTKIEEQHFYSFKYNILGKGWCFSISGRGYRENCIASDIPLILQLLFDISIVSSDLLLDLCSSCNTNTALLCPLLFFSTKYSTCTRMSSFLITPQIQLGISLAKRFQIQMQVSIETRTGKVMVKDKSSRKMENKAKRRRRRRRRSKYEIKKGKRKENNEMRSTPPAIAQYAQLKNKKENTKNLLKEGYGRIMETYISRLTWSVATGCAGLASLSCFINLSIYCTYACLERKGCQSFTEKGDG